MFKKSKTKKIKELNKVANKLKTTLEWCDVYEVRENEVLIGKNGKTIVKGIKINPINLFLETEEEREKFINRIRIAINKFNFQIFFSFVYIPINIDTALAVLFEQEKANQQNRKILDLLSADYQKLEDFKKANDEVEFHVYVRDENPKILEIKYSSIINEFKNLGMFSKQLSKVDFLNYFNYLFENPLINDFYFTRGSFSFLKNDQSLERNLNNYENDYFETQALTLGFDSSLSLKSKLVPTSYNIKSNYLTVGDKYVSNLLITKFPQSFQECFLYQFIGNPNVKCFMTIDKMDFNLANVIKKDYNEKYVEFQKTVDPTHRANLERELYGLDEYLKRSVANNDKTFNFVFVLSIFANDLKDLKELKEDIINTLSASDVKVFQGLFMQDQLFRIANPFLIESKIPIEIKKNFGLPMSAETVAGLHPFIFENLKDKYGFLFGRDYYNTGAIMFDQFFYRNEKQKAGLANRINGNLVLVGKSGSGKTTAMSLIIRNHIRFKNKVLWIDPENKNKKLTKIYGGSYIEFGTRGNIINIFDLKPVTFQMSSESELDYLTESEKAIMFDTDLAIKNVTSDVSQLLKFLFHNYSDEEASLISMLIPQTYAYVGIVKNENGQYSTFENLTPQQMPTFSDLRNVTLKYLEEIKDNQHKTLEINSINHLILKLNRICEEYSVYFDGQTNIDDSNNILAFGVKSFFDMDDSLKKALTHIMFKKAWAECSKNDNKTAIVIDEAHMFVLEPIIAKVISNISRRARKYNTVLIVGTQEPKDFADEAVLTEGKAIFNNSAYKLIMKLDKDPITELCKLINLNEAEQFSISTFTLGGGLFVVGDKKMAISVLATPYELKEID